MRFHLADILGLFLWLSLFFPDANLQGQVVLTEHTYGNLPDSVRPGALVQDLKWLAGHWKGSGLGGRSEEIWTSPAGGSMAGIYRLLRGETVVFYELMALRQEDTTVVLLIRHFEPDLIAWEDRETVQRHRLVKLTGQAAYFEGITFWRMDKKNMRIFLAMRQTGGEYRETVFVYKKKRKR